MSQTNERKSARFRLDNNISNFILIDKSNDDRQLFIRDIGQYSNKSKIILIQIRLKMENLKNLAIIVS